MIDKMIDTMIDKKKVFASLVVLCVWLLWCCVSTVRSDPIFVARGDTTACEGDWLIFSVFADALFPEDELEFDMEGAPEGAFLENLGKCG